MLEGFIVIPLCFLIPGRDGKSVHYSWSCLPREWEEKDYSAALSNNSCLCGRRKTWFTPSQQISNFLQVQFCLFFPTTGLYKALKWKQFIRWADFEDGSVSTQFSECLHVTALPGVDPEAPGKNILSTGSADFKVSEGRRLLLPCGQLLFTALGCF